MDDETQAGEAAQGAADAAQGAADAANAGNGEEVREEDVSSGDQLQDGAVEEGEDLPGDGEE